MQARPFGLSAFVFDVIRHHFASADLPGIAQYVPVEPVLISMPWLAGHSQRRFTPGLPRRWRSKFASVLNTSPHPVHLQRLPVRRALVCGLQLHCITNLHQIALSTGRVPREKRGERKRVRASAKGYLIVIHGLSQLMFYMGSRIPITYEATRLQRGWQGG